MGLDRNFPPRFRHFPRDQRLAAIRVAPKEMVTREFARILLASYDNDPESYAILDELAELFAD